MLIVRVLVFGLLAAALVCFALYIGTGQRRWSALGIRLVKWTVVAALGFFAVLLLERMVIAV